MHHINNVTLYLYLYLHHINNVTKPSYFFLQLYVNHSLSPSQTKLIYNKLLNDMFYNAILYVLLKGQQFYFI